MKENKYSNNPKVFFSKDIQKRLRNLAENSACPRMECIYCVNDKPVAP